ncbi:hypothetical protein KIH41_13505 [Litoribacter ruber]|uniref:hypothetical protein n=1 Tax=Litoribacter ruber TaxID=702568 RepID=UPI001BDA9498|nr:hypothetical protein [Litoribacter ruber]MBT0812296.1 hypothetical protein [Litoribacter ruber]
MMTVVFICGSLEPGKDGVGDYTRRLAGELIRQGHKAKVIALNDRHIDEGFQGIQYIENTEVPIVRLPSSLPENKRHQKTSGLVKTIKPDWISLQFVPYSYHSKGLPVSLINHLDKILGEIKFHIMFHELWTGMEETSSHKQTLLGLAQKFLIRFLIKKSQPLVVNTQSSVYKTQLTAIGHKAELLPLFGNIPRNPDFIQTAKNRKGIDKITFVLFGQIRKNAPVAQFAKEVALLTKQGYQFNLILIGKNGDEQNHWVSTWTEAGLEVNVLGEISSHRISSVFESATMGLSTTPVPLIEKSGAVAAMREHSLPVLCVAKPWRLRNQSEFEIPAGIREYQKGNLEKILATNSRPTSNGADVTHVSQQFLRSLEGFSLETIKTN